MENAAQAAESRLTENEERNNKKEQVLTGMCDGLHKIMQVLTQNREEEAQNVTVAIDRKLNVSKDYIKAEVLTSLDTLSQNIGARAEGAG